MSDEIKSIVDRKVVIRTTSVDILGILQDMESYFIFQLKASLDVYQDYDEFAIESWSDLQIMRAKLRTIRKCQLITDHEYDELNMVFNDIRSQWLNNALNKYSNKTEENDNGN